jgi:hypothetical protein
MGGPTMPHVNEHVFSPREPDILDETMTPGDIVFMRKIY